MHPNGRAHLLELLYENQPPNDQKLEPFFLTVADAYCFYVALKRTRAVRALRPMALISGKCQCFESRLKSSCEQLRVKLGSHFKQFEVASLEAYLLSPLMSARPKLVRIFRGKCPKVPKVESPCDDPPAPVEEPEPVIVESEPAASEQLSADVVEADANDSDDDDDDSEATPVADTITAWMTPEEYEASLPAVNDAVEEVADEPEYAVGDLVVVNNSSAVAAPGRYSEAIPSARVVGYLGKGIYEVAATYSTVEAGAGRKRRVNAMLMTPKRDVDKLHEDDTILEQDRDATTLSRGASKRQCIGTRQRKAVERSEAAIRLDTNVLLSAAMAITRLRS